LSEKGRDKRWRGSFLNSARPKIKEMRPEFTGTYGCGLRQSAVPCDEGPAPGRKKPGRSPWELTI
jgi:hypothetical protein